MFHWFMTEQPNIEITYEWSWYTARIFWEDNTVIADGATLDDLMKSIQDALSCHFADNEDVIKIDLQIPTIHFVFDSSTHAIDL